MREQIRFTVVKDGQDLGTATLNNGILTVDPVVADIMQPMRSRAGDEKAFRYFSDWSNGYVVAKPA